MDIVRNDDGTLTVPVEPPRQDVEVDDDGTPVDAAPVEAEPTTMTLPPGEGGYDEALAQWDQQQNPDAGPAVSTASGREQAMTLVHAAATHPDDPIATAVEGIDDPEGAGEALRHVLVGGVHSVEDFANEVAEAEGGEPIPAHQATTIIGQVLAELD
jgi:hypothetical protein